MEQTFAYVFIYFLFLISKQQNKEKPDILKLHQHPT